MTAHHHRSPDRTWIDVERRAIVDHKDLRTRDSHGGHRRQARGPRPAIVVAAHCRYRSKARQRCEDLRVANVAGMDDVIAAAQCALGLGAQETVRVRDQPDTDRHAAVKPPSSTITCPVMYAAAGLVR